MATITTTSVKPSKVRFEKCGCSGMVEVWTVARTKHNGRLHERLTHTHTQRLSPKRRPPASSQLSTRLPLVGWPGPASVDAAESNVYLCRCIKLDLLLSTNISMEKIQHILHSLVQYNHSIMQSYNSGGKQCSLLRAHRSSTMHWRARAVQQPSIRAVPVVDRLLVSSSTARMQGVELESAPKVPSLPCAPSISNSIHYSPPISPFTRI